MTPRARPARSVPRMPAPEHLDDSRPAKGDDRLVSDERFVTILFTDLVASSSLFAQHGDERADEILGAHLAVLRDVVKRHDGREVKSTGDGLMVAFSSAVDALRCAIDMQRGV